VKHAASTSRLRAVLEPELPPVPTSMRPDALTILVQYCNEVARWSPATDVSGFTDPLEVCRHLVVPTLRLSTFVARSCLTHILDIGAGSGAGSLPLLTILPTLSITCIEARAKAVLFLEHCARKLGLDVTIIQGRAESLARAAEFQGAFDLTICRAVASFGRTLKLALPFVRPGGACLCWRPLDKPPTLPALSETRSRAVGAPLKLELGLDLPVAAWVVRLR